MLQCGSEFAYNYCTLYETKTYMPLRILLFTAIIFPLMVFSQANYKAGYVITDAGDTLKGLINYLEWDNNPSTIKFQQQPGTTVASITAATVKEVGISGFGVYQRFVVPVTMFKVNVESISDTANTPSLSKALFLKLLLKGDRLNLYSYSDNIKMRFYVLNNKKTTPEELLIIRTRQDMQEQTHDVYRLQLLQIAAQLGAYTSKLESQMQSVNYSENSLRNAISA